MKPNFLDRAIGYVAPGLGLRRMRDRVAADLMSGVSGQRSYAGADRSRLNAGWHKSGLSADAEIAKGGALLRDRMRDLVRNNPHAASAVNQWVLHLVGAGIMPRANTGSKQTDKKINALFDEHAKKCDADGQLDIYGIQTMAVRRMVEDGDGLVRRRWRRLSDNLPVPVQYQVIEVDLLDSSKEGPISEGRGAIQGIEFDAIGKRTAYWMFTQHPGSNYLGFSDFQSKAIPASEIAHGYRKDRTQVRGVPWGSPVIITLNDLGSYEEAELIRKKLEACMVGVVVEGDETDSPLGIRVDEAGNPIQQEPGVYSEGVKVDRFEPGMFAHAVGGRDIKFNQPAATGSYEAYKKATLHTIAAGFGIPYMLLSGDLTAVNYSSAKIGLTPFMRMCEQIQWNYIIPMICQPMWEWFCEAAYLAGKIKSPYVPVKWNTPRAYSADPEKDARAVQLEVRAGLKSLTSAIAERGFDPDEVIEEIAASNKKLDAAGIILDSDPRHQSANGQAQQQPGEGGDDDAPPTKPKPK